MRPTPTTPTMEPTQSAPPTDAPGGAPQARARRHRHAAPRPWWASRLMVAGLSVLLAVVVAAPLIYAYAPGGGSVSALVGPAATPQPAANRTPNPGATPLAQTLAQAAQVAYVNQLISKMSLDQEIGQMIMIGFSETQIDSALLYQINQYHIGSAIIYAFNIQTGPQLTSLDQQLQSATAAAGNPPLLIATDQEGGGVNRLLAVDGPLPSASDIGATGDPNYARQRGQQDATALASVGINLNLAPVVDVMNTTGGDLGGRTFGSTPDVVTKMAGAYLSGLQASGQVAGTLKHFPGLGDVPVDPHQQLYFENRSLTDLNTIDWAPYKALIATGQVQAIMSTHVVLSAVDDTRPASLSYLVITGILRNQLGFNGVVITDGIYMKALSDHYSLDQIILYAIQAGNDIICSTYSIQSTAETEQVLHDAVVNGTLTKARIDDSVRRILLLKLRLGLLTAPANG